MKRGRGSGFPLEPMLVALTALACVLAVSQRLAG